MTEASHSAHFQRFLDSVAGTAPAFREELDNEALLALEEEEYQKPENAEKQLMRKKMIH